MSNHPHRSKDNPHPLGRSPKPPMLLAAREAVGLTPAQAADLIGVTKAAWERWEQGEREMSSGLWDLFRRRLREMPGAKYGLGTPTDPIEQTDPKGYTAVAGFGWKLADMFEDGFRVELMMSQTGHTRADVARFAGHSASSTGRWFETAESAVAWLRREFPDIAAVKSAIVQAQQRYPRLRDFDPWRVGRKNWHPVRFEKRGEMCAAILTINGEPRLAGVGDDQTSAIEDLLDNANVLTAGLGDDDREIIRWTLNGGVQPG